VSDILKLVEEIVESQLNQDVGYHVGKADVPAESLKGRGWYFGNKVGYTGTGFYFFGNLSDAKNLQKQLKSPLWSIDLGPYRLFRASNPLLFYQDIKQISQLLGNVEPTSVNTPELYESLDEIAHIFRDEHHISIEQQKLIKILHKFIEDIQNKVEGTQLSNRLLEPLGYEGIDNRGIPELDHYGVGSVLFHIKPQTLTKL
jgi:hypothetical protein